MIFSHKLSPVSRSKKIYITLWTLLLSIIGLYAAQAHEYKAGKLEIIHPWSRATVPTAKVAGGFFKIINSSDEADKLIKVTADLSDNVQIHEMAVVNGVMKMRELSNGIVIAPDSDLEFKPGSFHIMFMNLKNGLKTGEKFKAKLFFEKSGEVEVDFAVEAMDKKSINHDTNEGNNPHKNDDKHKH